MSQGRALNIVIFSTAYLPSVGGAELAIRDITDRISDARFFLITSRLSRHLARAEKTGNILVYRVGLGCYFDKILLPFLGFFKFFQIVSNFGFRASDLILWGMMASYGSVAAYFIKLFKPAVPFLLTLQEGDSETHLKWGKLGLVGFFGARIIRKADRIQVISGYLKSFALKQGAKCPIDIVPNGVDLVNFSRRVSDSEKDDLRRRLDIKLNEKIIISVSRLSYKNGIDILIKAVKSGPKNLKVVLAGDGHERKNLERLAERLGIKSQILFLGTIPNAKLPLYFSISDIFVRPSRSEGLGTAFLEAMAAGVPVIATSAGGIPDFLEDGITGLFSNIDDPGDLAKNIELLIEDERLRKEISVKAKKLIEERYNWEDISQKMASIFGNLKVSKI